MNFRQMSDGIQLHHHLHRGFDDDAPHAPSWLHSPRLGTIDTGGNSAGDGGNGVFAGRVVHAPVASVEPVNAATVHLRGSADAHQSDTVHADQQASQNAAVGGNGGADNAAAGGNALVPASGPVIGPDPGSIHTGANDAGNGGAGYFYGGMIHASLIVYEPINITVAVGYGSIALADQTNNVSIDQSVVQMAGIGGDGGSGNVALGGNVDISSALGAGSIATGANSAGNGGAGHFSGTLLDAPIVIYNPINIAVAGAGGTAHANQSNMVAIDQSATQIAGIGGNGGNDNAAIGGNVSTTGSGSGGGIDTGGGHAGNGGDGSFTGSLVHTSVIVYDPINISVAGYNSSSYALQNNNVHLDQFSFQMAGIGGNGGDGNVAMGGHLGSSGLLGGSDAIATGSNSAGNGGNGYFSGSLVDVSIAIYAPINIAVAGPHSTAVADQVNDVHIDQSAVQIAGIGGHGGDGNLALGGDLATHLLSDLHLMA
jgi:hypothetical protein